MGSEIQEAIGKELEKRWMEEVERWRSRASDVEMQLRKEIARSHTLEHQTKETHASVRMEALDQSKARIETLERECEKLRETKAQSEEKLTEQLRGQLARATEFAERASKDASELTALRTRVAELETPAARGRVGEFHVAETLRSVGFSVEDTSSGDKKLKGYLDLLVRGEAEGLRIAIEVKNRESIDPAT